MQEKLEDLKNQAQTELEHVSDEVSLQNLKAKFVGRKGVITEITKSMKDVSSEIGRASCRERV